MESAKLGCSSPGLPTLIKAPIDEEPEEEDENGQDIKQDEDKMRLMLELRRAIKLDIEGLKRSGMKKQYLNSFENLSMMVGAMFSYISGHPC